MRFSKTKNDIFSSMQRIMNFLICAFIELQSFKLTIKLLFKSLWHERRLLQYHKSHVPSKFYDICAQFQFSTHSKIVQMEKEIKFSGELYLFAQFFFAMPLTFFQIIYFMNFLISDMSRQHTKWSMRCHSVRHFVNMFHCLCCVFCVESEIVSRYPHNNVSVISYGSRSFFSHMYSRCIFPLNSFAWCSLPIARTIRVNHVIVLCRTCILNDVRKKNGSISFFIWLFDCSFDELAFNSAHFNNRIINPNSS